MDPIVVRSWIDDVQAERRRAEDELRRRDQRLALTREDIVALVESLREIAEVLEAVPAVFALVLTPEFE